MCEIHTRPPNDRKHIPAKRRRSRSPPPLGRDERDRAELNKNYYTRVFLISAITIRERATLPEKTVSYI
jgi:hypothetical protein